MAFMIFLSTQPKLLYIIVHQKSTKLKILTQKMVRNQNQPKWSKNTKFSKLTTKTKKNVPKRTQDVFY